MFIYADVTYIHTYVHTLYIYLVAAGSSATDDMLLLLLFILFLALKYNKY